MFGWLEQCDRKFLFPSKTRWIIVELSVAVFIYICIYKCIESFSGLSITHPFCSSNIKDHPNFGTVQSTKNGVWCLFGGDGKGWKNPSSCCVYIAVYIYILQKIQKYR